MVRFGVFELDRRTSELRKKGIRIKLQQKPLRILELLLERAGDVVTREELRQALWSPDVFVDFDHSLNSAVNRLRDALADSAANPRFVETLPRGYRFIAPVTEAGMPPSAEQAPSAAAVVSAGPPPAPQPEPVIERAPSPDARGLAWPRIAAAAIVAALAIVAAIPAGIRTMERRGLLSPRPVALAVLPSQNLSADPQQEFFSDGFTEEMIAQIGKLAPDRLRVIARTSVMSYKQSPKRIDQIGSELGVDYILESSIRRAGSRVRITADLIRVRDQAQIWARSYERGVEDILSLQAEVALAIAGEVGAVFRPATPRAPVRPRVSPEVHEAYLKGRYFLDKSPEGLQKSIDAFQEAVRLDPGFAPAYAGLADAYGVLGWGFAGNTPPAVAYPKARAAAMKALELNPGLAEAHAAYARVLWKYEWNWQAAEDAFKRAIELDPGSATTHESYFDYLSAMGRNREAYVELTRAAALDPVSLTINYDFGLHFARTGDYQKAAARLRKAIDLDPASGFVHHELGELYAQSGMYPQAAAELQRAIEMGGRTPHFVAALGAVRARMGDRRPAIAAIRYLKSLPGGTYMSGHDLAMLYAALGEPDLAMAALQQSYREHDVWLSICLVQFGLDPIRSHPGYHELLSQIGLGAPRR